MNKNITITEINENKFIIRGDNLVLIDNIYNIYTVIAKGIQTKEVAEAHLQIIENFLKKSSLQISYFINLNECGKNSTEARNMWKYLAEHNRTKKVALYGIHPVAKVLAFFFMGALIKKNKVRFFDQQEEKAISWLKN